MTRLEDIYGQVRTIKELSSSEEFIVKESFEQTNKTYMTEKHAIRAARRELAYMRSHCGIIKNHFGMIRTKFPDQKN